MNSLFEGNQFRPGTIFHGFFWHVYSGQNWSTMVPGPHWQDLNLCRFSRCSLKRHKICNILKKLNKKIENSFFSLKQLTCHGNIGQIWPTIIARGKSFRESDILCEITFGISCWSIPCNDNVMVMIGVPSVMFGYSNTQFFGTLPNNLKYLSLSQSFWAILRSIS